MATDDAFIFLKNIGGTKVNNTKAVAQASISRKKY